MFSSFEKRLPARMSGHWIKLLLAVALLLGACLAWSWGRPQVLRVALPVNQLEDEAQFVWPASRGWPGPDFLPQIWKLDIAQGIRMVPQLALAGKGTMETLLAGKADIAIASTAVLVDTIAAGESLKILAMTSSSRNQVKLITRRENAGNWLDKPIGVRRGTILESALIAQLQATGKIGLIRDNKLQLVNIVNPKNLIAGLLDGSIQSATLIRPHADYATALLTSGGAGASSFIDVTLPGVYQLDTYLITTQARWQEGRDTILKGLAAMKQSRLQARQNPERALEAIREFEAAGTPELASLPFAWTIDELVFVTEKPAILANLEREAKLRVAAGQFSRIPDFADSLGLLDEVSGAMSKQ